MTGQEAGKRDRDGTDGIPASASKLPALMGFHDAEHLEAKTKLETIKRISCEVPKRLVTWRR